MKGLVLQVIQQNEVIVGFMRAPVSCPVSPEVVIHSISMLFCAPASGLVPFFFIQIIF
jgi:hypothetical protein